jgi:endonuclease YncB( thermonuclease family)
MSLFKMRNPFKQFFSKNNSEEISNDTTNNIINTKAIETNNIIETKEIEVKKMDIINWEDTTPFTPPITGGQVIKVYDGDTFTLAGHLPMNNSPLFRFSIRLNGIDAPEIKGKTEEEITVANEAKNALTNLILHKEIILKNIGIEKYGRILADVYLDDLHVNDWLIRERYAVKYDGKTKKIPASWLKYRLTGEL